MIVADKPVGHIPDIAIEVLTEGKSIKEMRDRAKYYLDNGAKMVWLVYPDKQLIEVRTPDEDLLLTSDDTLDGGAVLPGFKLAVRDIFPQQ